MTDDFRSRAVRTEAAFAEFISTLTFDSLPEEAVRTAERCFVDTVGVTLAGSAEGAGNTTVEMAATLGSSGEYPLFGTATTTTLAEAVFGNSTAGHGIDFDDVTRGAFHPSVPIVAPILLLGRRKEASGKALVTAYVAGFETQSFLAELMLPDHYEAGWHATATFGTFGATAAVAKILELDATQIHHALDIAASLPAGLKKNFGTMTKPLHAGQAARSGLTAALLADRGFTAAPGAICGEQGFCDLYDGPDAVDCTIDFAGPLALVEYGVQMKKYPCCYFTHAAIAASERLRENHDLGLEDIEHVEITASQGADDALHYPDPQTGLEAKFSMHYPVAAALADGRVTIEHFDDENVGAPGIQAVRNRVTFTVDESLPYEPFPATVRIETTGGDTLERCQRDIPGTAANPLSDVELRTKFEMAADRALAVGDVEKAYDHLNNLRSLENVEELFVALSGSES